MYNKLLVLLLLSALAFAAPATEDNKVDGDVKDTTPEVKATERFTNLTSLTLPGASDITSSSFLQLLISGGAVVLGLVGLISVLALLAPLFGFKQLCYLMGTCNDPNSTGYFSGGALNGLNQAYDAYHTYNQPSSFNASPTYQRRALSYVGPILKALNTAFEKYEHLPLTPVKKE